MRTTRALLLIAAMLATPLPLLGQGWSVDIGYLSLSTRRAAAFEGAVGVANSRMQGIELGIRKGMFGIETRGVLARFLSDSIATGAGEVATGDIRLRVGPDIAAGTLGYGRRGLAGALGRRDWSFIRMGAQSHVPIGASGLAASIDVGWYPSVSGSGDFVSGRGADAETRVTYVLPSFPAYIALGYRLERFTSRSPDDLRPEELSSPFIGIGLSLSPEMFWRGPMDHDQDGVLDADDLCPMTPYGTEVDLSGCRNDSDDDGIFDELDACPGTPRGNRVDETGCRTDGDGDGVFDGDDACPATPAGSRVDVAGCRYDRDGDGVFDEMDDCPQTPANTAVDARGCPPDSDGDRVYDTVDACPNTAQGVEVDARGCESDGDGDRVPDSIDACPNTAQGVEVDQRGCPILFEEDETELVLDGVTFETASDQLTPNATVVLDRVAEALTGYPEVRVRVTGHTDSVGAREYNLTLSQARAESVLEYLASRGIARDRMEALGHGPDLPIADNATAEGRQLNRRVQLERIN